MSEIQARDARVTITGRADIREDGAHFYWPATSAQVRFRGNHLSARVKANSVWGCSALGIVVDGRVTKAPLLRENNGRTITVMLADGLDMDGDVEHTCILYKRLDASYDFVVESFETDGVFLEALPRPALRLEFYGDSVTAGACIECVDYVGRPDPCSNDSCYDNSWYGYAWQTARALGAEVHTTAQGGIAVFSGTGYFHMPETIGMEEAWDKMCYFPEAGEITQWDFSRFIPHAVIYALGQNDQHNAVTGENDRNIADPAYRAAWKEGYKRIVRGVADKYGPDTKHVFITTVLMHDRAWDDAIGEMVGELKMEGIDASQFLFSRNGAATPGHPRIPEHNEMASELTAYLKTLL